MYLIPAIDLLDGRCVRLRQGDFDQVHAYGQSAGELAEAYFEAGAKWLHVVDLAASRDGERADTRAMYELLKNAPQRVQTGGGVRTDSDIRQRLEAGASRVVVGSAAAESPEQFGAWLEKFGPEALVAALDVRYDQDGTPQVRSHGWKQSSGRSLWQLLELYAETPLKHVLCTDISKDGLMSGPNLSLYEEIRARYPALEIQASGGIRDICDLLALAGTGVTAAISGKALLDGHYRVKEAIAALKGEE